MIDSCIIMCRYHLSCLSTIYIHSHIYIYISFLMDQINEVVAICLELVQQTKVSPSDIGVIAAFRQQVLKIRLQLRQQGLSNVNVGSVEDFQVRTLSLSPYIALYHPLLPSTTLYHPILCSIRLNLSFHPALAFVIWKCLC